MTCPLKNHLILQSLLKDNNQTLEYSLNTSQYISQSSIFNHNLTQTPIFNQYINYDEHNYQQIDRQKQQQQQQVQHSLQINLLKKKMMEIQELSKKQIEKCKREIMDQNRVKKQYEKRKNMENNRKVPLSIICSNVQQPKSQMTKNIKQIGTNTQPDHRDQEILLLKQLIKQQSTLNKHLLNRQLQNELNIYQNITLK